MIVGRNDLMESMLNQCSVEWACWVECKMSRYEELENTDIGVYLYQQGDSAQSLVAP